MLVFEARVLIGRLARVAYLSYGEYRSSSLGEKKSFTVIGAVLPVSVDSAAVLLLIAPISPIFSAYYRTKATVAVVAQ